MKLEKEYTCQGGMLGYYVHESDATQTEMRFTVFTPPEMTKKGAYVVFLSGLTCTAENFTTKAHAYQKAAELGLTIIAPDTSPRGDDVPDDEAYDLGQGAGFYLNATQAPWNTNFQMESYIIDELLPLVEVEFSLQGAVKSIMGHSMGGHGALTLYFRHKDVFASCSAFSPIVAPSKVPWGQKAFTAYLGEDQESWLQYDACELVKNDSKAGDNAEILVDQGVGDTFLEEQLKPELFEAACKEAGQALTLRLHEGYDHSYFFIQSFMADHLEWHARYLTA